jgi:predicted NBD/HSP70 family sugar kinase
MRIKQVPSQLNLARVLLEIRSGGATVRSSLARSLHLSFATVSNLSKILEKNGFLYSSELRESSGGRRPAQLQFNARARFSLGLSIRHDLQVHLALLDLHNQVVEELIIAPPQNGSVDDLIEELSARYRDQLTRHELDPGMVIGAGVAIPGVSNRTTGAVEATTSPLLANLNLRDRLEEALSCPVYIHNDADLAALAFSKAREQDEENILLVYFSEGIGLGIVIGGEVYAGETGFAGELGHIRWGHVVGSGEGGEGLELKRLVSVPAMVSEYFGEAEAETKPRHDWQAMLREIQRQYEDGDPRAHELLQRGGRIVGQLVATLADIFDPGLVAIGGEVQPILPTWMPIVREHARKASFVAKHRDLMIIDAPELDAFVLAGCGEMVFQQWITHSHIVAASGNSQARAPSS